MSSALVTLTTKLAQNLGMGNNGQQLIETMKKTAFRGVTVSDEQMTALMVVANQYGLNPWTKEIYAFPDKGGIVPVVGVDGWARIMNEHVMFDGIEFEADEDSCTCTIYRKDRNRPTRVTEYLGECKKQGSGPWQSHPKRMLRHKAMIQCARLAFGFGGIYDPDEAERIAEARDITPTPTPVQQAFAAQAQATAQQQGQPEPQAAGMNPAYPPKQFGENFPKWAAIVKGGKKSSEQIIASLETMYSLTVAMKEEIMALDAPLLEGELV